MPELSTEVVAALIGFVGGLVGALIGGLVTIQVARLQIEAGAAELLRERREQQISAALQNFTGGSQKRNVGISVIEQYWSVLPERRPNLRSLLINQSIYLLMNSEEVHDWHERDNLTRMMRLVLDGHNDPAVRALYPNLCRAVEERLRQIPAGGTQRASTPNMTGVDVDQATLRGWQAALCVP
jgi:hypothetical protein